MSGRREQPATEAALRRVAAAADPALVSNYEGSAASERRARAFVERTGSRRTAAPRTAADDADPGLPVRRRGRRSR